MRCFTNHTTASPTVAHRHFRALQRAALQDSSQTQWHTCRNISISSRLSNRIRNSARRNTQAKSSASTLSGAPFSGYTVPRLDTWLLREGGTKHRAGDISPPAAADYAASAVDDGVLQRPLKEELSLEDMVNVFGYPRDLRKR